MVLSNFIIGLFTKYIKCILLKSHSFLYIKIDNTIKIINYKALFFTLSNK